MWRRIASDGINTLEETNVNDQMNTDKQNPDIAGEIHIDKSDLDDRTRDQFIISEYASDEIEDDVPLVHSMTQRDTLHAVAAILDPQQFEGMLQACVKLENDNTGRVSESQKCFQLGTQFRDTSSEHSTHERDTRSTRIVHHHQDNMCITTMTDEELTNDDEDTMGKGEQGGGKAIHARYGNRIQAMTEKELRRLMEENSGKYVVYDGEIMKPKSIKQLKNHTIVRIVDRMMGGGKKKGQKKQDKEETTSSSESDALQDMFMNLMKQDDDKGNSVFRTMMQLDNEMAQEALSKMKQAFAENGEKFGMQKLSFEAVEQWIYETRSTTQQAVRSQQEKAIQEAEQREQEVRRFKEEQKQIMIGKERQARENEREKREQQEKEAEKQR